MSERLTGAIFTAKTELRDVCFLKVAVMFLKS